MFSSVIVLFHCHTFLIFVLRSFQICCMVFFFCLFSLFLNTSIGAHPLFFFFNFILKFICCQFAACLFFGISLIKYFLFSPLSPWLLTLLPTLTIVCCGKFLLVEFFFFFLLSPPPSPPHPFLFLVFLCGNPSFILPTSYANSRVHPVCPRKSSIANYKPEWHQCLWSGGFCCCSVGLINVESFICCLFSCFWSIQGGVASNSSTPGTEKHWKTYIERFVIVGNAARDLGWNWARKEDAFFGRGGWILHSAQCVRRSHLPSCMFGAGSACRQLQLCWWRKQSRTPMLDSFRSCWQSFLCVCER